MKNNKTKSKLAELKEYYWIRLKGIYNMPIMVDKESELFNLEVWYSKEKERIIKQKMKS